MRLSYVEVGPLGRRRKSSCIEPTYRQNVPRHQIHQTGDELILETCHVSPLRRSEASPSRLFTFFIQIRAQENDKLTYCTVDADG